MTADYIAFHAADRPDAVAIVNDGCEITYVEFSRDIRKFTIALREFGLSRGATVAIDCDDNYFNWLLRLACEQLLLVSAPLVVQDNQNSLPLPWECDLILSGRDISAGRAKRHHHLTSQWLHATLARPDQGEEPSPTKGPGDPLRIKQTSGTTGIPKRVLYSRRIHEAYVSKTTWIAGFTRQSRYLLSLPGTVPGPAGCVRSGGTVVFETRMTAGLAIATHGITHTTFAPIQLKKVLEELPESFAKPADLTILSTGAALSRTLRDRALARLATDVCDMYGSNEAGYVSSVRGNAEFGTVWPGVQVDVVDERDEPVPHGQVGRIRAKTDCIVEGYIDDLDATARIFKNG